MALWVAVAGMAATLPARAEAACKYTRLGSIPSKWVGPRLTIEGSIDDTPVTMVVDTGAQGTLVSGAQADAIGQPIRHIGGVAGGTEMGFGGQSTAWGARLAEFSLGRFQWHGADVKVLRDAAMGLPDVLVGAAMLFQHDLEISDKDIAFYEPSGCGDAALAFWGEDVPWVATEAPVGTDLHVVVTVQVNGQPVRALVDSGSPTTLLDLSIARQLGFDPQAPGLPRATGGGVGGHVLPMWSAPFDSVAIGPEIVHHPFLVVADLWHGIAADVHRIETERWLSGQPRMILGADFVRSHHLLFATSQRRLYFSYNGGDLFPSPRTPSARASPASEAAPGAARAGAGG